jgi:prenyltransferase beta subunit
MEDPELTGEFVQCLRILGISREDAAIWPLIQKVSDYYITSVSIVGWKGIDVRSQALAYLLKLEQHHGGHGIWSKRSDKPYDRYHTAYCATIGLMSYNFAQGAVRKSVEATVPISRAFCVPAAEFGPQF